MTLTSAAVRRPAPFNEPLHVVVVAVLGNPKSKCHWRVKQISPGDFDITFCHHPDGVSPSSTPWLQNLTVGSLVIYKRTARSTTRPGEYVGQLISLEPIPDPADFPEFELPTTSDPSVIDQAIPAPPVVISRKNAEDRVRKAAKKEGLQAGLHLENDRLKGLWYLTQTNGRYKFRLKASAQTLEALVERFDVLKPGEVLAIETTTEEDN